MRWLWMAWVGLLAVGCSPAPEESKAKEPDKTEVAKAGDPPAMSGLEAVEHWTNVLEENPKGAHALRERANALFGLEEIESAIGDYTEAIKLQPEAKT